MEYGGVLEKLAPCGLDCSRCVGFQEGEIKKLSTRLIELLENYQRVAAIMQKFNPAFASYKGFEDILQTFAQASCTGCRSINNSCPTPCIVKTCHKEKAVDFCFQCPDFPCDKQAQIPIGERWLQINQRLQEIGAVEYYQEQNRLPRY
ncbi:MAG: DUF3795 domain-containing protein [Syntrophomonadaceae bacterium]|nr:DUF3795 domain-containing protein [Syntrophomonadaceae bacterium]